MKVIQLHKSDSQLIKKAKKQHRDAQHQLYHRYAPKMLNVCRRYIKDIHHAEEVMLNGFLKVFTNLEKFRSEGSFEGWIRRIMINESITFLRKEKKIFFTDDIERNQQESWNNINTQLEVDQIQELIDQLPDGYKMVFVLYAIDGYKHAEIATMLGVSESTSKTQLFRARKMLQKKLNLQNNSNHDAIKV